MSEEIQDQEGQEEHNLVVVHVCEDDEEANIIVGLLESNGIEATVENEGPHDVFPVEGDACVVVNAADAERALELLSELEAASEAGDVEEIDEEEA
jgi:hypothetical protein